MFSARVSVSALTLTALVALAACSAPGQQAAQEADATGPIKIANINAQSGQLSPLGQWEHKGVKLAVDEANKAGGVDGRQIKLDLFDSQGDPTVGTNLARKISSEGYIAMLGTAESAVTLAMAPILKDAQIPNITSGQSPKLADLKSPFLFLNAPTSVTFDETLAKYLVDDKGYKKIALISNNGAYGAGEHDAFLAALKSRNVTAIADEVVTPDQKDFNANLAKIREQEPEVLFIGAEEVQSGLIAKQSRELGLKALFAGGAPMGTDVYATTAGLDNAEGSVVSSPYLSNEASEPIKAFAAKYKAAYNEDARMHVAKAYDGASILIEALKQTKGAGGRPLADAIRGVKRAGLLGDYDYDESGVGIHATKIGLVKGGTVVPEDAS
ncbi:ABC transporter substrate-binding protein [Streptosporangium sp. NPDC023963]|uniref:ABC transporter substrate-binding protein n=1 Tax=Streptosporangium sp. NPDC023963 TaxID=3155608 RepID=UPI00343CE8C7